MTPPRILLALGAATAAASLACVLRWRAAEPIALPSRAIALARAAPAPAVSDSVLADAEDQTMSNDPFRLSNEPASVRYDPTGDATMSAVSPAPALRPALVLKAIVGGPPWRAVIDGIPGQPPGTVASAGARFDKLLVRTVSRDSVVLLGPDTTWTLTFKGGS